MPAAEDAAIRIHLGQACTWCPRVGSRDIEIHVGKQAQSTGPNASKSGSGHTLFERPAPLGILLQGYGRCFQPSLHNIAATVNIEQKPAGSQTYSAHAKQAHPEILLKKLGSRSQPRSRCSAILDNPSWWPAKPCEQPSSWLASVNIIFLLA